MLAKNKDLIKAFGTDNQLEVCRILLDKGEMQVRRHTRERDKEGETHTYTGDVVSTRDAGEATHARRG